MQLKFTLILLTMIVLNLNSWSQSTWENFDDPASAGYFFINGGLNQDFPNPDVDGLNGSATCGEYVRSGETFDVIVMDPIGVDAVEDVNAYVDGTKSLSLKVYSPFPDITVQITLENSTLAQPTNYPAGRHSEYLATTTTSGEWEELTFEFSAQPDISMTGLDVNRLVLLFAPTTNDPVTFLWDDLMGPEFEDPCDGVEVNPAIIENFECQRNLTYEFANGNLVQGFDNPETDGLNTSEFCGQFTKFPPPTNDGAFGGDFEGSFSVFDYDIARIDLYSEEVVDFLIIFQDPDEVNLIEQTFTTSGMSTWETFSADLSFISPSAEIDRVVLLLNPATDTEDVILFDNLRVVSSNSVMESESSIKVQAYPVPFSDELEVISEEVMTSISVVDMLGKELISLNVSELNTTIDTSELQRGNYMMIITMDNGKTVTKKLSK